MSANRTIQTNFLDGVQSIPNYIGNGKATYLNTQGWATYADAAGTAPVDGTGGSPNVTISASSSSPLSGDNSFLFVKDAANRQGQGWSYDFTINSSDQAKVLQIQFDYLVSSGTFVAGSSTTNSDVVVYIYDVTNGVLIQPSTFKLYSNSSTTSGTSIGSFQTASNSTSYRLIFHVGSTSASAYTLKVDNVSVSPTSYVYGTPITDWASCTITGSWSTNTTYTGKKRRVGDTNEYQVNVALAGAPTSASLTVNLPSGDIIDTTKLINTGTGNVQVGYGVALDAATNLYQLFVTYNTSTSVYVNAYNAGGSYTTSNGVTQAIPFTFGNLDLITLYFSVPIQGFSSSVQMSDNADTRQLIEQYTGNGGTVLTANTTNIDFTTKVVDTHGAWNGTTFTAISPGWYNVSGSVQFTANNTADIDLYKNNVKQYRITGNQGLSYSGKPFSSGVFLNGGDTMTLRSDGPGTLLNTNHYINITRSPASSTIAATETIAASYTLSTNTLFGSNVTIKFDTKLTDTHSAYSSVSGQFTCPAAGKYLVQAFGSSSINTDFAIRQNTTKKSRTLASAVNQSVGTCVILTCNAGDLIDIYNASSATYNGTSTDSLTQVSIYRIGL